MTRKIKIATDFAEKVGHRFRSTGGKSGEEFRQDLLENLMKDETVSKIEIDMDDTWGYPSSFLEEAFGGLVRIFGIDLVRKKIEIISTQDESLYERILKYVNNAVSK
jgi:hypothetical protein